MAMTFLSAKQEVARNVGGSAVSGQLTIAGQAIIDAIREIDSRHDWEFRLKTLASIPIVIGTTTYALTASETAVKRIHSALPSDGTWALIYARQRHVDRVLGNQTYSGAAAGYVEVITATGISIKLLATPTQTGTLIVRVYETIKDAYADGDNLAIPDRYLPAFLALARYNFLIDRDSEDARAQTFLAKAEQRIDLAIRDDSGNPDEDIALIPQSDWKGGSPDGVGDW